MKRTPFHFQSGEDTVDEVFETVFFFMIHESRDIQSDALHSLGSICIRHHSFMLESKLKTLYIDILNEDFYSVQHKIKVSDPVTRHLTGAVDTFIFRCSTTWKII